MLSVYLGGHELLESDGLHFCLDDLFCIGAVLRNPAIAQAVKNLLLSGDGVAHFKAVLF